MPLDSTQESILNDKTAVLALDRSGLFEEQLCFPDNLRKAVARAKSVRLPKEVKIGHRVVRYVGIKKVAVAGMGGSAIAGDILKDWVRSEVKVSMEICRGYHLPAYIDTDSLVFVISYSGDTEETLSCMVNAVERGCKIVSISSNGTLQRATETLGLPFIQLPKMAAARASLPYLFAPLPHLLAKLGILPSGKVDRNMKATVEVLVKLAKEYAVEVPVEKNFAKQTAIKLYETVPIIYSCNPYRSAALRFKGQINENCKIPARFDVFPELNHNEIIGWEASNEITRRYSLILLRGVEELPEVRERIDVLKERIFTKKARSVIEINAQGETKLARIFSLIFTVDMISMYLAILYNRDPVASEIFPLLKHDITERLGLLRRLEEQIQKLALNV
ncbi:MAG: bifunctional phosphoglucose/phosphomannose isomerase [Candidatus Bathyarchaeota archaeon]|jgi:glucose/mannose-6-phosphate isomerase